MITMVRSQRRELTRLGHELLRPGAEAPLFSSGSDVSREIASWGDPQLNRYFGRTTIVTAAVNGAIRGDRPLPRQMVPILLAVVEQRLKKVSKSEKDRVLYDIECAIKFDHNERSGDNGFTRFLPHPIDNHVVYITAPALYEVDVSAAIPPTVLGWVLGILCDAIVSCEVPKMRAQFIILCDPLFSPENVLCQVFFELVFAIRRSPSRERMSPTSASELLNSWLGEGTLRFLESKEPLPRLAVAWHIRNKKQITGLTFWEGDQEDEGTGRFTRLIVGEIAGFDQVFVMPESPICVRTEWVMAATHLMH